MSLTTPPTLNSAMGPELDTKLEREDEKHDVQHHEHQFSEEVQRQPLEVPFSHLSIRECLRTCWKAVMFAVMVSVGNTFDSYTVFVPGLIVSMPGFIEQFGTIQTPMGLQLDARYVSVWSGMISVGQLLGFFCCPLISDNVGRKMTMWALAIVLALGCMVELVARDWRVWTVAKLLNGWGTGLVQGTLGVYVAEISPPKIRGILLAIGALCFTTGQIACSIGFNVVITTDPFNYRKCCYSQFAMLGIFVPALLFAPESPWFLCRKGKIEQCKKVLAKLNGHIADHDIELEYQWLAGEIQKEREENEQSTWRDYLRCLKGTDGRRTFIAFTAFVFQQFVGIALMFGLSTYFFQLAGYAKPFEANLIQTCIQLLAQICGFFVVDRVGRRWLALGAGFVEGVCTISMGALSSYKILPGTALVALACLWTFAYGLGTGPLGGVYVAEIPTPRLRAKSASISLTGSVLVGLIFNYCVPILLSPQQAGWGIKIGYFFGGLTFLWLVVMYFCLPETKGRTFAELDEMFDNHVPARHFRTYKTKAEQLAA